MPRHRTYAGETPVSTEAAVSYDAAMHLAVEQADLVKGKTYPNPPVGAVILDRDGRVVAAGPSESILTTPYLQSAFGHLERPSKNPIYSTAC